MRAGPQHSHITRNHPPASARSGIRPPRSAYLSNPETTSKLPPTPVGPDRTHPIQSYPLKFRHLQDPETRMHAPVAIGYSTSYCEIVTCSLNSNAQPDGKE
jgi:hypothetical protein